MSIKNLIRKYSLKKKFTQYYHKNLFNGKESISGKGSDLEQTAIIRIEIPKILEKLNTKVFIDAPCGDFYWMQHVDLKNIKYIGLDIVYEIIKKNSKLYGSTRQFICKNIVTDKLPDADVILIRDCWVHLSNVHIFESIMNIKRNNIKYLLSTSFPGLNSNSELMNIWRPINLALPPFNFPEPLAIINEGCTEDGGKYKDKSLILWEVSKLPVFRIN
jgi:hypothetical protein